MDIKTVTFICKMNIKRQNPSTNQTISISMSVNVTILTDSRCPGSQAEIFHITYHLTLSTRDIGDRTLDLLHAKRYPATVSALPVTASF